MRKFLPLLILTLALMAACAPATPAAPAALPSETPPEREVLPQVETPLPVPVTPAAPAPTEAGALPEVIHYSDYTLTAQVLTSPDGAWTVEALRGEIRPTSMTEASKDVNRITAENPAAGQRWEYVERTNHGMGEGVPDGFTFTADSSRLYFYDSITPDGGCGQRFTSRLRYMDLATGKVEPVAAFDREGYFSIAPYASRAAEIVGTTVEVTDLASGEKKSIPFMKPSDDEVGTPIMYWSEDGNWLAFDLRTNALDCNTRPVLIDTLAINIEKGEANNLGMWADYLGAMGWDAPGWLRLQTGRDNPASFNIQTGETRVAELDREALERMQVELGLRRYLTLLYQGRDNPQLTAQAAELFAGDWSALSSLYPTMRFTDNAAMLNYACSRDEIHCYPVRQIKFVEKDAEGRYVFDVQFLTPEASVFDIANQDWFRFNLDANLPDTLKIYQLPPLRVEVGKP